LDGTPYAPNGPPVLALGQVSKHKKHRHHKKKRHHKKHRHHARDTDSEGSDQAPAGQGDISDQEKQPDLPECNGKNGVPKVDCLKPKPLDICPKNTAPAPGSGQSPSSCRVLPICDGTNGEAGSTCWKGADSSLAHKKHHHKSKKTKKSKDISDDLREKLEE